MTHKHRFATAVHTGGSLLAEALHKNGGRYLSDVLAHVLDDHFVSCDGLHGEEAPLVDPAAAEAQLLLSELQKQRQTCEDGYETFLVTSALSNGGPSRASTFS